MEVKDFPVYIIGLHKHAHVRHTAMSIEIVNEAWSAKINRGVAT